MNSSPIYRQINILANRQRRHFDRLTAEAPFSGAQGRVLHYLLSHPDEEIFQKDIEEEFGLRPSTATTLLQSMERKGLLRREPSEKDARYKKLTLTPERRKTPGSALCRNEPADRKACRQHSAGRPENLAKSHRTNDKKSKIKRHKNEARNERNQYFRAIPGVRDGVPHHDAGDRHFR